MLQNVWQDVRYGFRGLVTRPGFTLIAILTLALGIGSAAAIFSVIQNVLLDPAPYADVERIAYVQIRDASRSEPGGRTAFQVPEFLDYQEQSQVFEDIIGGGFEDALLTTKDGTLQFAAGLVTSNTFRFLGVAAQLGRGIVDSDVAPGAPPVFVMSHKMWVAHHSMDPAVVGRTFVLNGVPTTCVGVMPPRFTKQGADLWKPMTLDRADPAQQRRYVVFQAKLKRGVTFEQATAEMDVVARRIAKLYPDNYPPRFTVHVVSWVDGLVRQFRTTLYTLFAAVGVLLLIACTNVANMLLARAAAREKEMAIRTSLGAGRWLLVRQLLIESLMLAFGGAVLGSVLAYVGIVGVKGLMPQGLFPTEADIRLNIPVLAFSLGVAVFTSIVFGLVPALQTVKKNMADPLKDSGRGVVGGFRRGKLRSALVIGEVALSLVLLAGAGLLIRNFVKLQSTDLGLDPSNILVARLPLPREQYKTAAAKQQFFEALLTRLHALPGVVAATETSTLPPYGGIGTDIDIPGKTHTERWEAIYQLCSDGYFRTLGLRVLRGRTQSRRDQSDVREQIFPWRKSDWPPDRPEGDAEAARRKRDRKPFVRGHRRHSRREEQRHRRPDPSRGVHPIHGDRRVRARHSRADAGRSRSAAGSRAQRNLDGRSRGCDHDDRYADELPPSVLILGAQVQPRAAQRVCVGRIDSGCDRGLQRHCVHGRAADARDRDTDGAWSGASRCAADGVADGAAAHCHRCGDRVVCKLWRDAVDCDAAEWCISARSADPRRRRAADGHGEQSS